MQRSAGYINERSLSSGGKKLVRLYPVGRIVRQGYKRVPYTDGSNGIGYAIV